MAEAIGLTMGALSLTSLFSTCVECFGYFSASRDFERDRNILLVKLDFERNKLLIWGNSVGVLRETGDGLLKALSRGKDTHQKSRKQLECIISILTDTEKLHEKYGVRSSEGQRKGTASWSVVSKNNLDLFKLTLKRFLLRNPEEASKYRKYKVLTKLRWAIHDKQKFQGLINDLKELVDQLFLIQLNSKLLVNPGQLDESMKTDIELIDNVEQLSLVQEACEGSYQAWSDHAGSVIAASEKGTTDRRTFEEISKDIYNEDSEIATRTPTVEREKSGNFKLF
jgi:Prion-inhibition and propagation